MSNQELELYHFPYTGHYAVRDQVTGELYEVTLVTEELPVASPEPRQTQALCILPPSPDYYEEEQQQKQVPSRSPLPFILVGILLVILATGGTALTHTVKPVVKKSSSTPVVVKKQFTPVVVENQTAISQQAKILAAHLGIPQDHWPYVVMAWNDALTSGISPEIFVRQINQESGFQVVIKSNANAIGIAQIIPSTAQAWGVDPTDPVASLRVSAEHMAWYVRNYGSYAKALTCYNGGCGWITTCTTKAGVFVLSCLPQETRNYIYVILGV